MSTIEFPSDLFASVSTKQIRERAFVAPDYLVKGIVPREGFGIIYGHSGSFKSSFVLDLGHRIAGGWQWAERRVSKVPVVYICAEGAGGIELRIRAFLDSHPNYPVDAQFTVIKTAPDLGSQNRAE